jgi:hypothetical protein
MSRGITVEQDRKQTAPRTAVSRELSPGADRGMTRTVCCMQIRSCCLPQHTKWQASPARATDTSQSVKQQSEIQTEQNKADQRNKACSIGRKRTSKRTRIRCRRFLPSIWGGVRISILSSVRISLTALVQQAEISPSSDWSARVSPGLHAGLRSGLWVRHRPMAQLHNLAQRAR